MSQNKIMPSLWFNNELGNISSVVDYYKYIFENEFEAGQIMP
ncbi:MAG: hypothetical protein NT127_05990 [Sphingobacteriales bacterium]|nr:hypothetical protein [Sphingobacteriales bacterium]